MRKYILVLVCLCAGCLSVQAQSVMVAGGGSNFNGTYGVSYSIGQVAQQTTITSKYILQEGVLQPLNLHGSNDITSPQQGDCQFAIYPNPTTNRVVIRRGVDEPANMSLFNGEGKLVQRRSWDSGELVLQMEELPSGIYFLRLDAKDSKDNVTYKVIKQ